MTTDLVEKTCTPCKGGIPPLSADEAEAYRRQAPEWALRDEATRIDRTYRFRNFADAFAFVRGTDGLPRGGLQGANDLRDVRAGDIGDEVAIWPIQGDDQTLVDFAAWRKGNGR